MKIYLLVRISVNHYVISIEMSQPIIKTNWPQTGHRRLCRTQSNPTTNSATNVPVAINSADTLSAWSKYFPEESEFVRILHTKSHLLSQHNFSLRRTVLVGNKSAHCYSAFSYIYG